MNLNFSPPTEIQTSAGPRLQRVCRDLPQAFWTLWRENRESLSERGYTLSQDRNKAYCLTYICSPVPEAPPVKIAPYTLSNPAGLLPYQIPVVSRLCAALIANRRALDASEMGTGKSYHAIASARELALAPCIICPLAVIPSWKKVCRHFGITPSFIVNWEGCKTAKFRYGQISQSQYTDEPEFTWFVHPNSKVLFIFDEAHRANGRGTGFHKILCSARDYRVLTCTGTPATRLREFHALGYMLGLFRYNEFSQWLESRGNYKNLSQDHDSFTDEEDMARLHKEIFPRYGVRIRKIDIPGFPPCQNICETIRVPKPDLQQKTYERVMGQIEELQANKIKWQEKRNAIRGYQNAEYKADAAHLLGLIQKATMQQMVLYLRYRQLAEHLKVSPLAEYAKEIRSQGYSVIIFCNFTETIAELSKKFKDAAIIQGGQKGIEREAAIEDFQSNRKRVLLANIDAGGVGISLHDLHGNYPRVALVCPNPSAIKTMQALGRIDRAGGKSPAINRMVFAAGTIEERVCESVQERMRAVGRLVDGDLAESDTFVYQEMEKETTP